MTIFGFSRTIQFLVFFGFIFLFAFLICLGCGFAVVHELYREADFRHRYGDNWKAVYEERYGPLEKEHNHIALCAISFVALAATGTWLVKALVRDMGGRPRHKRSKHRHLHTSPIERVTRYKRNGLLGIYFGVP